jgi:hypothetical protein
MSSSTFTTFTTSKPTLFGRGGYNGPNDDDEESRTLTFGRGGYNKGPDDDEEEDGRGGYN